MEEEKRFGDKEEQRKLVEQIRREREETERIQRENEVKQLRLQQEIRQRTATTAIKQFRQRVILIIDIKIFGNMLNFDTNQII